MAHSNRDKKSKTDAASTLQSTTDQQPELLDQIDLKNRYLAAVLTWLIPGLGQWYQDRHAKAILFLVCILGTFLFGCFLGSDAELGPARVVYASWKPGDYRLYFIPQACVGVSVLPALSQANRVKKGRQPAFGGFMAPPSRQFGPTLDELYLKMPERFEMGTMFTVTAGLLNLLAIFDAFEGPVFLRTRRKEDEECAEDANEPGKA